MWSQISQHWANVAESAKWAAFDRCWTEFDQAPPNFAWHRSENIGQTWDEIGNNSTESRPHVAPIVLLEHIRRLRQPETGAQPHKAAVPRFWVLARGRLRGVSVEARGGCRENVRRRGRAQRRLWPASASQSPDVDTSIGGSVAFPSHQEPIQGGSGSRVSPEPSAVGPNRSRVYLSI